MEIDLLRPWEKVAINPPRKRGCGSMVECGLPKPETRVRFPSPAPLISRHFGSQLRSLDSEWRPSENHPMVFKQPLHRDFLFLRIGLVDGLLARRQAFVFGKRLKELLDFASRLVGIEDFGRAANG